MKPDIRIHFLGVTTIGGVEVGTTWTPDDRSGSVEGIYSFTSWDGRVSRSRRFEDLEVNQTAALERLNKRNGK